jgi:iron complex outermembrane recepter protein
MAKSRSLQQAVRFALATATATAGVSALHAQEAPAPAATAAPVEEVVVTGSRLRTPNETSISPITTVSAVDVQQTGLTRVEDVLNNLPMVFAGMNSTTSNGADGTATVDLRGLGNQRTLVLVDGLRLGPGEGDGRNYSDINQVPAALIERVDILTGGASAVYGADAVAGVVNFVLNTHFEGVRVDAGYHFNEHSNDNQDGVAQLDTAVGYPLPSSTVDTAFGKNGAILMGSNFADNRGNATAYITYDNQGPALQSKFDYGSCSLGVTGGVLGCGGSYTSAKNGAGGSFFVSTPHGISFITNTVDGKTGQFRPIMVPQDLYNYGPLNYYQVPNTRWTGGTFLNYDINSHVTAYANVMYMRNELDAQIAPSGDFGYPSFIPCADPLLTAQEASILCAPGNVAKNGGGSESFNGITYPGVNAIIARRNVEGGDRIFESLRNSVREVSGLKGDFGDAQGAWTYNVYAQHGTVDGSDRNLNYTGIQQMEQALNVLPATPGSKTPVCGGPTGLAGPLVPPGSGFTANTACVPWNIWVPNGVNAAQLAFIDIPLLVENTSEEYVVDGSVTGDIGKYGIKTPFADSGLQANFGAEYRSESAQFLPDYESQQGFAGGGGGKTPPVTGEFHVSEVFTELRMPLASHQPFADDLSIEGGYRYSKYTEGFDTNTFKLGLEWAPVKDIRFRGSYQRAVRAPNVGELFTPQSVGLDGSVDPCTGSTPAASLKACEASGLSPALYGHLIGNPAEQYNGLLGGNPDLKPETADTYSFGFVVTPSFLPNLTLSADYYNIKILNIIAPLGGNTILLDCLATLEPSFCSLVHRDAGGSLWRTINGYVIDTTINEGEKLTKGVDLKGTYRQPLGGLGSLLVSLEGTYLQSLQTTPVPGFGSYDCVGLFGDTCGGDNPHWRHVMNVSWSTPWDGLDLNVRWRFIGPDSSELTTSNTFLHGTPYLPLSHIPAFNYIDLTGTFNIYKNVRLELGVNNIADKSPPLVTGGDCSTSSPAGANCNGNTFPGVYDAMGRYLFATVTAQF